MKVLFRADTTNGKFEKNPKFTYFIFGDNAEQKVIDEYGKNSTRTLHKYETKTPLNLLDMTKFSSIHYLIGQAYNDIKIIKAIEESFPIENGKNMVMRNSETDRDAIVSSFICNLGEFDGYEAEEMSKKGGGKFHREIMICNPRDKLILIESKPIVAPPPMKGKHGKKRPLTPNSPQTPPPVLSLINSFNTPSPVKGGTRLKHVFQ